MSLLQAALQRAGEDLSNGRRLAGSGGTDELEVLGLVEQRNLDTGDRHAARGAAVPRRWAGVRTVPRLCASMARRC